MKISKFLRKSSWILLGFSIALVSVSLDQSPVYSDNSNQETTEQTTQEQEIPSIPENQIDIYRSVHEEVCRRSEDISIAIPLGTDNPIPIEQIPNDNSLELADSINFEAVGYIDSSGQPHSITARDVCEMIQTAINNGGSFDTSYFEQEEVLIADVSSSFLQAKEVSVVDLIVRNPRNGRYYLHSNVRVDSFCRDAVNAFLNDTWSKNDIDLRNLNLRNIEE